MVMMIMLIYFYYCLYSAPLNQLNNSFFQHRPLHIAIAHGNTKLIEYLIDLMSCLTLDIYNNLKQTPLHLAVITGQAKIVGKLITAGANANMPDRNGHTPTHLACQRSYTECLEQLFNVANGVDLELKNFGGFTPLHEAVFARCAGTVRCLAQHGANVNCKVDISQQIFQNKYTLYVRGGHGTPFFLYSCIFKKDFVTVF